MRVFSDKAAAVLSFLKARSGEDFTSKEIAAATGIETKSITGVINGLAKKGLVLREEVEGIKVVRLTDAGKVVDPMEEKEEPIKAVAN